MAEIATIARPYAEAAFEIADKTGALDAWSEAFATLSQSLHSEDLQKVLGNPLVGDGQMVEMLLGIVSQSNGQPAAEMKNFLAALAENDRLTALAENDRLTALPAVTVQFEALKNERQGAVDALVETAFPFQDAELQSLVSDLERRFKRKVRPEVKVDRDLIGGARITVGDQVIDGSVRGKLAALAAGLAQA